MVNASLAIQLAPPAAEVSPPTVFPASPTASTLRVLTPVPAPQDSTSATPTEETATSAPTTVSPATVLPTTLVSPASPTPRSKPPEVPQLASAIRVTPWTPAATAMPFRATESAPPVPTPSRTVVCPACNTPL